MSEQRRFTAQEILDDAKITGVDPNRTGRQYTKCPGCSADRHGFNRKAPCLAVNIDSQGVRWFCNHCEVFKGGRFFDSTSLSTPRRDPRQHPRPQSRPTISGYALMQAQARRGWMR